MGIGFPTPTTVVVADINAHNYDASIGQKGNSESLAVALSVEQQALLQAIASALGASVGTNQFGTNTGTSGAWTTVVTKTVLLGQVLSVHGFTAWGDADAEWSLEKSSGQIGGGRSTPSDLMACARYVEPVVVVGPDTVTLRARHWYAGKTVNFYTNLEWRVS